VSPHQTSLLNTICKHYSTDWCHICGRRRTDLVDVVFPENAEHTYLGSRPVNQKNYLRLCGACAAVIVQVSQGRGDKAARESAPEDQG